MPTGTSALGTIKRTPFFLGCTVGEGWRVILNITKQALPSVLMECILNIDFLLPQSKENAECISLSPLQIFSWLKQAGCRPPGVCNSKLHRFLERPCYQPYIYANDIIYSRAAQGLLSVADRSKHFGNCYAPYI